MNLRPRFDVTRRSLVLLLSASAALSCSGGGKAGTSTSGGSTGTMGTGSGGATATGSGGASGGSGGAAAGTGGAHGTGSGGNVGGVASGGTTGAGSGGNTSAGTGGGGPAGGASSGGAPAGSGGAGPSGGAAGAPSGSAGGVSGGQWSSTFPTFTKHTIASFSSGYMTFVADIDHDGKPDVVALSSASDGLVWFKNPSWTKYTITTATAAKGLIYSAPYDIDGDGDLDVAIASDFSMTDTTGGGTVSWAENPSDPTQSQNWTLHKIGAIPTSHRLRWGDIDGDGTKELIDLPIFGMGSMAPAYAGAVALTAFFIPQNPKDASATWKSQVIDSTHLEVAHGIEIVDWDGDKAEDILTAANDGVQLFRPSLNVGAQQIGAGADGTAPTKGSSEVALGSLGGARFIATIDPWHGTDTVIYTPGASATALWARLDLGADFEHGHGMAAADLNGDGYDEVVAGGGMGTMAQIIYRYVPSTQTWDKISLDLGGVAVSGLVVADLNGDGALDIVTIGTSPTNNVVWYENVHQ